MNNGLVLAVATLIVIVSDVLLMILGALLYRQYNHPLKQDNIQDNIQDNLHHHIDQDLKALSVSLSALGERLAHLETHMDYLRHELTRQHSLPNKEVNHQAIKVATKMALQGANVEELIELCGLTRGEAELIRMLHANHRQSNNDSLTD
jgi:hypothetical protein